jgi:hypothetical protein
MVKPKFSIGDRVFYIGTRNDWTFSQEINQNEKGTIDNYGIYTENEIYSVKFDSGLVAEINSDDLKLLE